MVASSVAQLFDLFILTCLRIVFYDAPQSVESLWASDQPVAEISTWQHTTLTTDKQTNIHDPVGIRTHNISRRAAEDLHLTLRGHWDRHIRCNMVIFACRQEVFSGSSYIPDPNLDRTKTESILQHTINKISSCPSVLTCVPYCRRGCVPFFICTTNQQKHS
jgi:hypothetical protein